MTSSLVADYDSDSIQSGNDDDDAQRAASAAVTQDTECAAVSTSNYFARHNDDDDDDDDGGGGAKGGDGSDEEKEVLNQSCTVQEERLPNPLSEGLGSGRGSADECSSSVFVTSFQRAAEAKQSILERHVRMTENTALHGGAENDNKSAKNKFKNKTNTVFQRGNHRKQCFSNMESRDEDDDKDHERLAMKRKNRSGINDSLVPPKRALGYLDRVRKQERPWTMKK